MSDQANLLHRARAYAEKHGVELTTVSKALFGDWRRLDAIASGTSYLRPPTLEAALKRMTKLEARAVSPTRKAKGASDGAQIERQTEERTEEAVDTREQKRA